MIISSNMISFCVFGVFLLHTNTILSCIFVDIFFVAVYKFFEQRNVRLRGNPDFAPGAKFVFTIINNNLSFFGCKYGELNVGTSRIYQEVKT